MKSNSLLGLILVLGGALLTCTIGFGQAVPATQPRDGDELASFPRLEDLNDMIFSPDGTMIATLRGKGTFWHKWDQPLTMQLWAVPSGKLLWTGKDTVFKLIAFSPDCKCLVGITGKPALASWNTADGKPQRELTDRRILTGKAVFLPDDRTLVVAINNGSHASGGANLKGSHPGEIQLWDMTTGQLIRTSKVVLDTISQLAISPDGKTVAIANENAGENGTETMVNLVDLDTDSIRQTVHFDAKVYEIGALLFSPDGNSLVVSVGLHSGKNEIRFLDPASGQLQSTIDDTNADKVSMSSSLAFCPDGQALASFGDARRIFLWNSKTGKMQSAVHEADSHYREELKQFFTDWSKHAGTHK